MSQLTPGGGRPGWPLALTLLVSAMRRDQAGLADLAARMGPGDWQQFAQLAIVRHRVVPLIAPALKQLDMPAEIHGYLDAELKRNAMRVLTHMAETKRVLDGMGAAGIPGVVLKGWPLALDAYGNPSARHAGDIDLMIPPDQIDPALQVMGTLGYAPSAQNAKKRLRGRMGTGILRAETKDIELNNPDVGIALEMHWQPFAYRAWSGDLTDPSTQRVLQTPAGPVRVLGEVQNLSYLTTHGALHLWARLKWLADIAALAHARGASGLEADMQAVRSTSFNRPVALGLRLASEVLGSPLPASLDVPDRRVAKLERWVLNSIPQSEGVSLASPSYHLGLRRMALSLSPGWREALSVVRYDTIRRLRLGLAGLSFAMRGG